MLFYLLDLQAGQTIVNNTINNLQGDTETLKLTSGALSQQIRETKLTALGEIKKRVDPIETSVAAQRSDIKDLEAGQNSLKNVAATKEDTRQIMTGLAGNSKDIQEVKALQAVGPTRPEYDATINGLNSSIASLRNSVGVPAVASAVTSDATPAVIGTFTPAQGQAVKFLAEVVATRLDDLEAAIYKILALARAVPASETFTQSTAVPNNNETVTIGTTVYTFKTVLSTGPDVPYEVLIGGTISDSIDNLVAAVNDNGTPGTDYGVGTVAHPDVTARKSAVGSMEVVAKVPGTAGNSIATTETTNPNGVWGGATMSGGSDMSVFGKVVTAEHEDDATWAVDIAASSSDVEISVTGAASKSIAWKAVVQQLTL